MTRSRASRNDARPVLLSALVCPGLGQIANGERLKGAALAIASVLVAAVTAAKVSIDALRLMPSDAADLTLAWLLQFLADLRAQSGIFFMAGTAVLAVLWAYSVLDAYWGMGTDGDQ